MREDSSSYLQSTHVALLLLTTVFMTFRLVYVGTYPLSIVPFSTVLLLLFTLRIKLTYSFIAVVSLVVAYPIFVVILNTLIGGILAQANDFVNTYALWIANLGLLAAALTIPIRPRFNFAPAAFICLSVMTIVGGIQFVLSNLFGISSGIILFGDRQFGGVFGQTLHIASGVVRIQSFYYEPSFFGRVAMSLAAICVISRFRILASLILGAMVVLETQSPGAAVLLFLVFCFAVFRDGYRIVLRPITMLASLVTFLFVAYLFRERFQEVLSPNYNPTSSAIRLYYPFFVLMDVLKSSPFGVSLGANDVSLVHSASAYVAVRETKVTNGIYEILLYTGVFGIALLVSALVWSGHLIRSTRWKQGLLVLFFIAAPIASSSLLSFEGNFTMIVLILQHRRIKQGFIRK